MFFLFKIIIDHFIFPKNSFSKIWSINRDSDGFMCWSGAKSQIILLSLRLSRIEFRLVSDYAESSLA